MQFPNHPIQPHAHGQAIMHSLFEPIDVRSSKKPKQWLADCNQRGLIARASAPTEMRELRDRNYTPVCYGVAILLFCTVQSWCDGMIARI